MVGLRSYVKGFESDFCQTSYLCSCVVNIMANSWRSFSSDKMSFCLVLPSTRIRVKSFLNRFKSREKRRGKKVEKLTARDLQNTNLFVERVQPQIHRTRQRQRNPEIVFKHYLINLSLEVPSSNKTKAGPR